MESNIPIPFLLETAAAAGKKILDIYDKDFEVFTKDDQSPLTLADQASNDLIVENLTEKFPDIPVISEENKLLGYEMRKNWEYCWLVDPLDGTKEFIKKNGEFTVNIALIRNGKPVIGLIYIPVHDVFYFAKKGLGSFRKTGSEQEVKIHTTTPGKKIIVAGSRSHRSSAMDEYLEKLKKTYREVEFVAAGSALKFTLVAEGKAHVYPRFGPTMEWDTAAGQVIVEEAGGSVRIMDDNTVMGYNRENLLNPNFIVEYK
jgi:3'(2'), 5'-bisphosphate nucleotidase